MGLLLLDESVLETMLRFGAPAFLGRLVDVYLQTTRAQVDSAESSAATGDWDALVFAAHSLKSSAGNLGLSRMLDIAHRLELAARSRNVEETRTAAAGLRQIWSDSCAALVEYRQRL